MAGHEILQPGGFLPPTLPSPPTSSASATASVLPHPRFNPLKPGGAKESSFIDYVDRKLLAISRRYEKRFNADFDNESSSSEPEGRGYETFDEMAQELDSTIDIVWVSGTPSLQAPYLLTLALTTCTSFPSFPFTPRPTFPLLQKLDLAFYSLLCGQNPSTGSPLPGFQSGRGKLSTTEKVRIKGLVERTRVAVVEAAGNGGSVDESGTAVQMEGAFTTDDDDDDDDDDVMGGVIVEGNHGRWEMEIARVYERTIVELGLALDSSGMALG